MAGGYLGISPDFRQVGRRSTGGVEIGIKEERQGVAFLPGGVDYAMQGGAGDAIGPVFHHVADIYYRTY